MPELVLRPVGAARTPVAWPDRIPTQGVPGTVEVRPELTDALLGLERASHVHVLAWLDRAPRDVLRVRPRRAGQDGVERGVFAVRTPVRPNPLALSTTQLLGVEGTTVHLARLDLWDGTPIVDLKPYSPGWDQVLWAADPRRTRPWELPVAHLREGLRREAEDAVGSADTLESREVIAAVEALVGQGRDPRDPEVRWTVPALDARVDLLLVLAGASFGNGRLCYDPEAAAVEAT